MLRSDLVKVVGGFALGAVLTMAVLIAFDINPFGGRSTRVTLFDSNGCKLGKETFVLAKVSDDLTWKIENRCDTDQTVSIGNFRTDPTSAQQNCTDKGPEYPFTSDAGRSVLIPAGDKGKIKLKVVNEGDLPRGAVKYYFDICRGGEKVDPELEIEKDM